jgi:hypothetical protein
MDDLLDELQPDLAEHGEDGPVREMVGKLLDTGTSSARQRQVFAATGSLPEVARWGADLTARC